MAQRIPAGAEDTPPASREELWWTYLRDLGRYDLGAGMPANGPAAIRDEWARLDSMDVPIPERVELLIAFCVRLGAKDWAVRARTEVGRASARRRSEDRSRGTNPESKGKR